MVALSFFGSLPVHEIWHERRGHLRSAVRRLFELKFSSEASVPLFNALFLPFFPYFGVFCCFSPLKLRN
jgi:hypothetical protein